MDSNQTITLVIKQKESTTKQLINKLHLFNAILFTICMVSNVVNLKNDKKVTKEE